MKTPLRYLVAFSLAGLAIQKSDAQCHATDIHMQNIVPATTQSSPNTCTATFDLTFSMENNNGNKFIFLHAWAESAYPDYFNCVDGSPSSNGTIHAPLASDLEGSFLNIGIDNSDPDPVLLTSYLPDAGVTLNSVESITKTILPDGSALFALQGVTATFPVPCNTPFLMALDFWSSQSAQAQNAQCVNCHVLYAINYLSATAGIANCVTLTYSATLQNLSEETLTGYYLVYADVNGDGHLATAQDVLIKDTTQFSITAGSSLIVNGTIPPVNINQDLLLEANITEGPAKGGTILITIPSTLCAPLPVTFKSFTATRVSRTNVALKWETATETNNSGFAVLRNMGSGVWEMLGFIPSQAVNGTSSLTLSYTFTDLANSSKGITQYRIKQVDIDGNSKFSEIRAVRGFGQSGKVIVYPNPSSDGRVNVLFDDAEGTRNAMLTDMSGRIIRQWKGVTGNTIQIENLGQGIYSLKIINLDSGAHDVEKIIVNRR